MFAVLLKYARIIHHKKSLIILYQCQPVFRLVEPLLFFALNALTFVNAAAPEASRRGSWLGILTVYDFIKCSFVSGAPFFDVESTLEFLLSRMNFGIKMT